MTDRPAHETDQLPEEQPGPDDPKRGSDPGERAGRAGVAGSSSGPDERRATGNEHDDSAAGH